jgi:oligoendopeptidase F
MNYNLQEPTIAPIQRTYLPQDFELNTWEDLMPFFEELKNRNISSKEDLERWLADLNELESYTNENAAWRYIRYTCNTENEEIKNQYLYFINQISPRLAPYSHELNLKLVNSPFKHELKGEAYKIFLRSTQNAIDLYREENISLQVEAEELAQKYAEIQSQLTIEHNGQELTMQQAAKYLKNSDRALRKEVYDKIINRRLLESFRLDEIFDKLVKIRTRIARNAGFENYRDYKFKALGRFDYTIDDVYRFHDSVKEEIVPLTGYILKQKQKELGPAELKPYDLDAEPEGQEPLKPYDNPQELTEKSIRAFSRLHPVLGKYLSIMKDKGFLDLDSRKGKAPGGYNYPLDEVGVPFIFMNASGKFRDMVTMMHEGGHAVHSFLTRDMPLSVFKHTPSEVSELASMSMELISMDVWNEFFKDKKELKRVKKEQLEGVIDSLPWIATVDKFQNWIYTHPDHSVAERSDEWRRIYEEFHPGLVDWRGYEEARDKMWQRQLHIFEVPFYYIEYGIAQLGALAMWRNYENDNARGLANYINALSLGYTRSVPAIYEAGGIRFDFSKAYIHDLAKFIREKLEKLEE